MSLLATQGIRQSRLDSGLGFQVEVPSQHFSPHLHTRAPLPDYLQNTVLAPPDVPEALCTTPHAPGARPNVSAGQAGDVRDPQGVPRALTRRRTAW